MCFYSKKDIAKVCNYRLLNSVPRLKFLFPILKVGYYSITGIIFCLKAVIFKNMSPVLMKKSQICFEHLLSKSLKRLSPLLTKCCP